VLGGRTPTVADLRQLRYTEGVVLNQCCIHLYGGTESPCETVLLGGVRELVQLCSEPVGEPQTDQPEVFTLSVGQTT